MWVVLNYIKIYHSYKSLSSSSSIYVLTDIFAQLFEDRENIIENRLKRSISKPHKCFPRLKATSETIFVRPWYENLDVLAQNLIWYC